MKTYPPRMLVNTWIYFAYTTQPEYASAKRNALENIFRVFCSIEIAELYLDSFTKGTEQKSA